MRMKSQKNLVVVSIVLAVLFMFSCGLPPGPTEIPPSVTPTRETPEPINRAPIAKNSSLRVKQETTGILDLLPLASDPDGDQLSFSIESSPRNGIAGLTGSTLEFTPAGEFTGPDQLTYEVNDGKGGTAQGIIDIEILSIASPIDQNIFTDFVSSIEYLFKGPNPIQTGISAQTIEKYRGAVLNGKVTSLDGEPLEGVIISVLDHPEYGQTKTRVHGGFDMAVNGGGYLTVNYEKDGYLGAQRHVKVPWLDYVSLPDVVLLKPDAKVTEIDLNETTPIQVARGNTISDKDGTRQATLFFPQGTKSYMTFEDGTEQPITKLNVWITEYTVGPDGQKAMPAELPPNSAYTYATEFNAVEAIEAGSDHVWFEPAIISYVENFLEFPTGSPIPMGYYDRDRGVWVATDGGLVIKILSITNGLANVDIDGSESAASSAALSTIGVTEPERRKLAELYKAGQSLWRVPVAHFTTPYDMNQAVSCKEPCPSPDTSKFNPMHPPESPDTMCGSIIGCQTQTLGEVINITGTPYQLVYQSDRTLGNTSGNILSLPLTGDTISSNLKEISVAVSVGGQVVDQKTFPPQTNLTYRYEWNGRDAKGRLLQGRQPVTVALTYIYPLVYQRTDRFGYNGTAMLILETDRTSFNITRMWNGEIGGWKVPVKSLGGWTLNIHHSYDPRAKVLYLGNGEQRSAEGLRFEVIEGYAGNGAFCANASDCIDNRPAHEVSMQNPSSLAVLPDGSLLIADRDLHRIRKVDPSGRITRAAGSPNGANCDPGTNPCGDGGPAEDALLIGPESVAAAPDGSYYIVDSNAYYCRVRHVDTDGIITTLAGTGVCGERGDNGPAVQAQLYYPQHVAADPAGNLYIAEAGSPARIRRVGTDGLITTVAGGGVNNVVDRQPALEMYFQHIEALAVASDGNVYFLVQPPTGSTYVGRLNVDGRYYSVAKQKNGTCSPLPSCEEGAPVAQASIGEIQNIALDTDDSLYLLEKGNRLRRILHDGRIITVAGNGVLCSTFTAPCDQGDGGSARNARLNSPQGIAVRADGVVFLADTDNHRIRRLTSAFPNSPTSSITIPSEDGMELYIFNNQGRHLRTLHALTGATLYEFSYDSKGLLFEIKDGDNNVTKIGRGTNGNPISITSPFGLVTSLFLDTNGYLGAVSNPENEQVRFAYSAEGLMSALTDARGFLHKFQYDAFGRLIKDEDAASGFTELSRMEDTDGYTVTTRTTMNYTTSYRVEFLPSGDLRMVNTYPNGLTSEQIEYGDGSSFTRSMDGVTQEIMVSPDPRWGILSPVAKQVVMKTPGGLTTNIQVNRTATQSDPNNPLTLEIITETVSINNRNYSSTFTASTRTWVTRSPEGREVVTVIDEKGRVISNQIAGLAPIKYVYDNYGRLASATQGTGSDGRTVSFTYDNHSYLASITDPMNRTAYFEYDLVGRITKQTLPDGRTIELAYDENSNLLSLTPPGKPVHIFDYTSVDLLSQYNPPDIGLDNDVTQYNYNADKQPTLITRPDKETIRLTYDAAGRLDTMAIAQGVFDYAYDPSNGNLSSLSAPGSIQQAYEYDGDLLASETWIGGITGNITYTYDNDFRLLATDLNNGDSIPIQYDDDSLITQAGALSFSYDQQNGLLTGTTLGKVSDTLSYNDFGELERYTVGSMLEVRFERDTLGRITKKIETIAGINITYEYEYDLANRLTVVKQDGKTMAVYTYDDNGNRLTYEGPGSVVAGSYDNQDRLLSYGNTSYTYTANGELSAKTSNGLTTVYDYDDMSNLTKVVLPTNKEIDYLIDGSGRRIGKKVDGILVQGFIYENRLRPIAELDGNGNIVSRFIYVTRVNVPDFMIKGGIAYRFIFDHLGSPRLIVDTTTGSIAQRIDYDEFGIILNDTNPGFQPFGFAGGLYDSDTKLLHYGMRDYDGVTGRWISKDPIINNSDGGNLYMYSKNNPVTFFDPTGMFGEDIRFPTWLEDLNVPQPLIDSSAGFGDVISFGMTSLFNELTGASKMVNKCSSAYSAGEWAGIGYSIASGFVGGARAAGTKAAGKEFSHWIPNRKGGPRSIWNGNYVTPARHYYHDPFRYPPGWRSLGPKWHPIIQQLDRIPNIYKGGAIGAIYGSTSASYKCGCK